VIVMEVLHQRCAGVDISKKDAKVCVRVAGSGSRKTQETVGTWGSMTNQILELREHLVEQRVTCVVMEATGDYWKPFYYLLEDAGFDLVLVNARHVKNMPGRKSDVSDAAWLSQLGAHGLVRASFVPPAPIRELRDLTRTRTSITRERSREMLRLEKLLEDAGIKLSARDLARIDLKRASVQSSALDPAWPSACGTSPFPRSGEINLAQGSAPAVHPLPCVLGWRWGSPTTAELLRQQSLPDR